MVGTTVLKRVDEVSFAASKIGETFDWFFVFQKIVSICHNKFQQNWGY